jgi:hypothetical protein
VLEMWTFNGLAKSTELRKPHRSIGWDDALVTTQRVTVLI